MAKQYSHIRCQNILTKLESATKLYNETNSFDKVDLLFQLRLHLVRVKAFPENEYFLEMLFSGKENVDLIPISKASKYSF